MYHKDISPLSIYFNKLKYTGEMGQEDFIDTERHNLTPWFFKFPFLDCGLEKYSWPAGPILIIKFY